MCGSVNASSSPTRYLPGRAQGQRAREAARARSSAGQAAAGGGALGVRGHVLPRRFGELARKAQGHLFLGHTVLAPGRRIEPHRPHVDARDGRLRGHALALRLCNVHLQCAPADLAIVHHAHSIGGFFGCCEGNVAISERPIVPVIESHCRVGDLQRAAGQYQRSCAATRTAIWRR